jgi:hypothetical protein
MCRLDTYGVMRAFGAVFSSPIVLILILEKNVDEGTSLAAMV